MKRLASLVALGTIALGSMMIAASAAPIIPSSSSQRDRVSSKSGAAAAGGFIPTRGAAACPTAGAITTIGPTMDIVPIGGLIMVAETIRIGVTGIGTGTDGQSATKPY